MMYLIVGENPKQELQFMVAIVTKSQRGMGESMIVVFEQSATNLLQTFTCGSLKDSFFECV